MSEITITFGYSIGQSVCITAIGLRGNVIALMMDSEGVAYRVVYWSDATRKAEWLFAWEISP